MIVGMILGVLGYAGCITLLVLLSKRHRKNPTKSGELFVLMASCVFGVVNFSLARALLVSSGLEDLINATISLGVAFTTIGLYNYLTCRGIKYNE